MFVILIVAVAVGVGAIIAGGGGHTFEGFGKDMHNTGDKIEQNTGNSN